MLNRVLECQIKSDAAIFIPQRNMKGVLQTPLTSAAHLGGNSPYRGPGQANAMHIPSQLYFEGNTESSACTDTVLALCPGICLTLNE